MMLLLLAGTACGVEAGRETAGPSLGAGDQGADEGECNPPPGQTCDVPLCDDPCGYNEPDYESRAGSSRATRPSAVTSAG